MGVFGLNTEAPLLRRRDAIFPIWVATFGTWAWRHLYRPSSVALRYARNPRSKRVTNKDTEILSERKPLSARHFGILGTFMVQMEHQDWDLVSLLKLCLTQNRRADWDELVDLLQPVVRMGIRRALARFGSSDLTDDLTQDVFLKLCERNFSVLRACKADNRAALQAYVITIAASTVTDYFRFQASLKKGSGKSDVSLQDLEPFLVSDDDPSRDAEHRLFLAQIQRCLETQQERNRTIFWLYHRHGYKPKSIAALPGIGMGSDGVETLLYRLTIAVRDCLRKSGVLKEIHRGEGAGA